MQKNSVDVFDYANFIMKRIRKGIVVSAKSDDKVNSLTIGWGEIGYVWSIPTFTIYIRKNRFTTGLVLNSKKFTINVPLDNKYDKEIIYLGTHSGRSEDKLTKVGFHINVDDKEFVSIDELPLTIECEVLYSQLQNKKAIPNDILERYYPEDVDSFNCGSNKDEHYEIIGKITNAYILK